jgi:superfamily II DNA/RNA helicase
VGQATGAPQANKSITQYFQIFSEPKDKLPRLFEILDEIGRQKRILVFTLTKVETSILSSSLRKSGISAACISSNLSQASRERVLGDFKSGKLSVLVATDVASRGLDIPNVEAVINYNFPQTIEAYVHRIGRTGRAGKKGVSYTFLTPYEFVPTKQLISVIQKSNQVVPPELYSFKTKVQQQKMLKSLNNHRNYSNFSREDRFRNNRNNFYKEDRQNNNFNRQNSNNNFMNRKNFNNSNNNNNNNNNKKRKSMNNEGEDKGFDNDVLENLKKDPKKLAAIVSFINSLN